ncbi:MAG: flagellar biosynthesis anti-sigma factor FlgM [Pseudomonadota bacterium]
MEITGKLNSDAIDVYTPDPRSSAPAAGRHHRQASGSSADKVVLSPKAMEIQDARQRVSSLPDVNEDRVHQIRRRLTAGTYSVNGEKIAFNMIKESVFDQMA